MMASLRWLSPDMFSSRSAAQLCVLQHVRSGFGAKAGSSVHDVTLPVLEDKLRILQWQLQNKLLYREQVMEATPLIIQPSVFLSRFESAPAVDVRGAVCGGAKLLFWAHLMSQAKGKLKRRNQADLVTYWLEWMI